MAPRILIGLTGNIATGKSTVARFLGELGGVVIDADAIARQVVEPGQPALAEIARAFGEGVLAAGGRLDRKALGALVFNDPARLRQLEAITHPAVHAELERRLSALPPEAVAVIEVIKLFENGWDRRCDQVWVATCPEREQVARLMRSRQMSEAEARARVAAQNPQAEKLACADVVIDTSGSYEDTERQVRQAWVRIAEC